MLVTKKSIMSGIEHSREIDVTPEEIEEWKCGAHYIQDVFPHLSPDDREFLMTGITPEEWEDNFGEKEEVNGHEDVDEDEEHSELGD